MADDQRGGPLLFEAVEDLPPAILKEVEERCRDTDWCRSGMIGPDESLIEIVKRDRQTLARLGVTQGKVANVLDHIAGLLKGSWPENQIDFKIGDRSFRGFEVSWMGSQTSPFFHTHDHGVERGSSDFFVVDALTGKRFTFPMLAPALIRRWCFFEGKAEPRGKKLEVCHGWSISSYRVDPEEVVRFFGISEETVLEKLPEHDASADVLFARYPPAFLYTADGLSGIRYST